MRSHLLLTALLALSVSACSTHTTIIKAPDPAPDEIVKPEDQPIERDPALEAKPKKVEKPAPEMEFAAWCTATIELGQKELDRVVSASDNTVEAVLVPLNMMGVHLDNAGSKGNLYSEVHPDPKMRAAGQVCVQQYSTFTSDFTLNRAVYDKVAAIDAKQSSADVIRFRDKLLLNFRRAGVDKDDKTRARLKELNDEETKVGQEFDKNIREDVHKVLLDPEQLDGMPEDWKAAHPVVDGKVTVTTDYPDVNPFRTYAKDAGARMTLYKEYLNRGWPANDAVLKKLLALRQERAKLLGYKNWADYITEDKMIKSGKAARDFVEKITKLSTKRAKADYNVLLARYKKDNPKAKSIQLSDALYYEELVRREDLKLDSQEVRKYFDYEQSKAGLLLITGRLFGIEYRPVKDADADVWHVDVDVYDVHKVDGGQKLGRIYLDMHPRDGKYKHAAQFSITSGVTGIQLPEGALVCNFSRGLMNHDEVVTMFHEFGHLVHHVLGGHVEWGMFSGVATERDFVEAPSQLLEEWAWDHETLALFAKDADGKVIPADLVEQMRAAELFGEGYRTRTQMFYASMSLRYHTLDASKDFDATKILADEQKKYSMFPYVPDTHMQVNFGHLNGYSAMYYTYMWSLVIAKDMFSAFQKAGMLDQATAYKYRDTVLAMGGRKDAADLVADFLGRKYSFASFQAYLENKQPKK